MAEKLGQVPRVCRLADETADGNVEEVATEAAVCLADIESSCAILRDRLLPNLLAMPAGSEEIEDLLDDIAEEYRHISYHIRNTRLFSYVVPEN
jgi:hypothetical protein